MVTVSLYSAVNVSRVTFGMWVRGTVGRLRGDKTAECEIIVLIGWRHAGNGENDCQRMKKIKEIISILLVDSDGKVGQIKKRNKSDYGGMRTVD